MNVLKAVFWAIDNGSKMMVLKLGENGLVPSECTSIGVFSQLVCDTACRVIILTVKVLMIKVLTIKVLTVKAIEADDHSND